MAEIRKVGSPLVTSALTLAANRINGTTAGEGIQAGDACHISSNGQVYRSIGSAAGDLADVRGFAAADVAGGEIVTLVFDVAMRYGEGLPSGENLYLSGTIPGGLADCPSPAAMNPVAFVADATRVHVLQS